MSAHSHDFPAAKWSFLDPVNTAAFTTVHVMSGALPVVLVTHDLDDGTWQFLCGTTNDKNDCRVVCLGCMMDEDPSLFEIADLPMGWSAWRGAPGQEWHREPPAADDE
jgi:hypothetical protein